MKFIFLLLLSFNLFAEEQKTLHVFDNEVKSEPAVVNPLPIQVPASSAPEEKTLTVGAEVPIVAEVPKVDTATAALRGNSTGTAMLGYQFLSTWVPSKWAFSYAHILTRKWSLEAEYSRSSWGIGAFGFDAFRVTEGRYSLLGRRYWGNSFNWIIGAFKNDFHAELGDAFLKNMSNVEVDDFRVQGIGATVGMGNRWQWENGVTFSIDWMRMNVPLFAKKVDNEVLDSIDDNSDAATVKKWVRRVSNIPTFVLLGLNIGYTF